MDFSRVLGAMANASPDLDNAEAQRQLNNNNRPIGSGFWETECTSSKLFECSRIKALAGQRVTLQVQTHFFINVLPKWGQTVISGIRSDLLSFHISFSKDFFKGQNSIVVFFSSLLVAALPTLVFSTDERDAVQKKTFTKWVNSHLSRVSCRISDLYNDLRDGYMLTRLLEVLSGELLVGTLSLSR